METSSAPARRTQAALGIVMIVAGSALLLHLTGLVDIGAYWDMHRYWPLIIVVVGVVQLAGIPDIKAVGNGLWSIFIGLWLFMVVNQMVGLTFRNSWPVFVVAWGVKLLGEALFARHLSTNAGEK